MSSGPLVIAFSLLIGLFSVVPQMIVPFAATLAKPEERNRVVGVIMSGLLIGILLARTVSGVIGAHLGWRAVYRCAAALMVVFAAMLRFFLPYSRPAEAPRYHQLLGSLPGLLRELGPLQEAAVTGALVFGTFSVFWTTLVFRLEALPFHLGAMAAGIFGLVGAAGAFAATLSGRMAGRLRPEARSRINTIYMVAFFLGGTAGSLAGGFAWACQGWHGVCLLGMILMAFGLAVQTLLARRERSPGRAQTAQNCRPFPKAT